MSYEVFYGLSRIMRSRAGLTRVKEQTFKLKLGLKPKFDLLFFQALFSEVILQQVQGGCISHTPAVTVALLQPFVGTEKCLFERLGFFLF